ncbi:MAG: ATP-binding protein [Firmicutes bacterium]|nr:ATP-binding protein [Bacillota bacterium]
MNKQRIYDQIIAEERQRRDAVYATALLNDSFAKLDLEVRNLTLDMARATTKTKEAEIAKKLKDATPKRDIAFAKSYKIKDLEKELKTKLFLLSGLTKIKTDFSKPPIGLENVYNHLETFVREFPKNKKPNRVISGPTGTGKTYAVQTLGNSLIESRQSVLYVTAFQLINRFKSYCFERDQLAFDDMIECDVLIIDDLGTEPVIKNITDEYLYNLINERYTRGKSFIITTNLDRDMMTERYGDRISSRVFAKETTAEIKLGGIDLRTK